VPAGTRAAHALRSCRRKASDHTACRRNPQTTKAPQPNKKKETKQKSDKTHLIASAEKALVGGG